MKMSSFIPKVALIMRSDEIINEFNLKRVTIDTSYGPVNRCFEGYIYDVPVLMIYGDLTVKKFHLMELIFSRQSRQLRIVESQR